jgi:diaminopimelate epimerase
MRFHKYHALGNDYIVLNPADFPSWPEPSPDQIRVVCHRNFGVGSDGILWGPLPTTKAGSACASSTPTAPRRRNPATACASFSRFLWDQGSSKSPRFTVETPGGV